MSKFNVEITTVQVGQGWVAATQLGGMTIRGKRVMDKTQGEVMAVRNLLWKLAGEGTEDEPLLALELAMEGTTLSSALGTERQALPDPSARAEEVHGTWSPWPVEAADGGTDVPEKRS